MKVLKMTFSLMFVTLLFTQCLDDDPIVLPSEMFTVTIENVSETFDFFQAGVFNTPVGASAPGPLLPGSSYSFSFNASKGHKLSFATMFVKSNDLFYGPSDEGLDLFTGDTPLTGDITSMINLWDAGKEVNEAPGMGANQPLNQAGPNTGADENGNVMMVNDGFMYPMVNENIKVMLEYDGVSMFTATVENLATSSSPLAPGAWVVNDAPYALYKNNMPDYGMGLEGLAEDGAAGPLGDYLMMNSGYVSPLAPGVWAVGTSNDKPLFMEGTSDYGAGLEALAENGDPSVLSSSLQSNGFVNGVFNTPASVGSPGPLMPGDSYSFSFTAEVGQYLSFATMLVHTNDFFFAPQEMGINLFNGEQGISGDITSLIKLWDAGTEVNEFPGAGIHQPARLNGGMDENGIVKMANDGFSYPSVEKVIKVTIAKN